MKEKASGRGAHCPVDNGFAPTETECRLRSSQRGNCICSLLARGTKVVLPKLWLKGCAKHTFVQSSLITFCGRRMDVFDCAEHVMSTGQPHTGAVLDVVMDLLQMIG